MQSTTPYQPKMGMIAVVVFGFCLSLSCLQGGPASVMVLKGFQTRGTDELGRTSWDMVGEKAVIEGSIHHLTTITLHLFLKDGDQATVKSPACTYNQATGLIDSDAALVVRSRQMILNGVGYDILTGERKLRVRSNVHMRLKAGERQGLQLFRKSEQKP